jgi:VWFA-related protein
VKPHALAGSIVMLATAAVAAQQVTFRSSLDLVSVAVVVRDGDGRLVRGLRQQDFEVVDNAQGRPIAQFEYDRNADARLALLVDSSGSMVVGARRERAQLAADFLIAGFSSRDSASVFTFDSSLQRLTPFTSDADVLRRAIASVVPFGTTCLYDAIVHTVRSVESEQPRPRAVVLLTDGIDTASAASAGDAASAAAALDLPIYVVGVGSQEERARGASMRVDSGTALSLAELARQTGGTAAAVAAPAQLSVAARGILEELHEQYLLAFQTSTDKGWHALTVRVKKGRVQARSRNGYLVQ